MSTKLQPDSTGKIKYDNAETSILINNVVNDSQMSSTQQSRHQPIDKQLISSISLAHKIYLVAVSDGGLDLLHADWALAYGQQVEH